MNSYLMLHSATMFTSLVVIFSLIVASQAILFGSEGGCGSFGCKRGGCSQCDPEPPCASAPPPPPLPCDSCGRRKREAGVRLTKNRQCTNEKLKEIIEKAFDKEATNTISSLNSTLHHSDHMLILCTPSKENNMTVVAKMDHFCLHEDDHNSCYVFGTGLRAKEV